MKNKVGHTSSTILNSCSFQIYRLSFRNLYSILLKQTLLSLYIIFHSSRINSSAETFNPMFAQTGRDNDAEMFSDDVQHQVDGLIVESPGQTLQDVSGRVQSRGQFNYCR